ncbi:MAG TPA: DegT/DnrJ/EryC1/StrS family aminotransferase [Acidobacteriota bacterium]|nr:DegT/DnrJ/EryC1/StrS family aminotransferase [Acidobacteriota bacterium]
MSVRIPFIDLSPQTRAVADEFVSAVRQLTLENRFIGGHPVETFERRFAEFCGAAHCVALNSGTDALRFALLEAGVGAGDEVITSPFTFIATTEIISQIGARAVLADVDPRTYNLDPQAMESRITSRTKAILPVHIFGLAADMEKLHFVALQNGLRVIEDASQAHGAEIAGQRAGTFGRSAAFSFYPTKNLGAFGDAGALTCNDPETADHVRLLRNHGQDGYYTHRFEGYNSRMDALQAALLILKLEHLEGWIEERRRIVSLYREGLQDLPQICFQSEPQRFRHCYHIAAALAERRDQLIEALSEKGIEAKVVYPIPLHLQRACARWGHRKGDFPAAEKVSDNVICLPVYPGLAESRVHEVVEAVREFYAG